MKRTVLIAAAVLLLGSAANAQMTAEYYKSQYDRQIKILGAAGVGVETILDKWESVAPEDGDMLEGRFAYYLTKASSTEMVSRKERKYLGLKPTLELKDSLGRPTYYYQIVSYDDSLFAMASSAIEKAISLYPEKLEYRIDKVSSLLSYERESPDMVEAEMMILIDKNASGMKWTYEGEVRDDAFFQDLIQEYCSSLFSIGTQRSYESFLKISERMSKLYPKVSVYVSNLGSYWLVAKDNPKKAASFYKKALKIDPEDYAAQKNMKLIQSWPSQKGQPSK